MKFDFQKGKQLRFSEVNYLNYTKKPNFACDNYIFPKTRGNKNKQRTHSTPLNDSDIVTRVKSDHSIVKCKISTNNPPKGKGFGKLNSHFLRHDADFVSFIKNKISEFKEFHSDTSCNPHVIWDAFKCTITGHCIQYCCRKKKEGIKNKLDIQTKIDQINSRIYKINRDNDHHLTELDSLETKLDKIFDQETAGLIARSRIRWAEHGEKISGYFCNLEKRSNDKKNIFILKNNLGSTIRWILFKNFSHFINHYILLVPPLIIQIISLNCWINLICPTCQMTVSYS